MQLTVALDPGTRRWSVTVDGDQVAAGPADANGADAPSTPIDLGEIDPHGLDSVRVIVAAFTSGDTVALVAGRPAGAKGHDRDAVAVQLTGAHAEEQVFDPRLSTEYDPAGTPRRFGIELWLGQDPEGEQHPLRLAGEADAEPVTAPHGLRIHPMHAHDAHADGVALYLLIGGSA